MPMAKFYHGGRSLWPSKEGKPIRIGHVTTMEQWGDNKGYGKIRGKTKEENSGENFGALGNANGQI